jgi:hypothetical protein
LEKEGIMRASNFLLWGIIACALLCYSDKPIFADTYQVFYLTTDEEVGFYAMDDNGNVVLVRDGGPGACEIQYELPTCYLTYHYGVFESASLTPPDIVDDIGTPCTPAIPPGTVLTQGVCNNGFDVLVAGNVTGGANVYVGSYPNDTAISAPGAGLGAGELYLNSEGDFVFRNAGLEEWYFAVDETQLAPEPSGMSLMAIGVLLSLLCHRGWPKSVSACSNRPS